MSGTDVAMSVTDVAMSGTDVAMSGTDVEEQTEKMALFDPYLAAARVQGGWAVFVCIYLTISLRVCYAMSSTDLLACGAMQCAVQSQCMLLCDVHAISGTDLAYAAMRFPVLT
eukprot:2719123-Rhodomonas_salina.2